MSTQPQEITKDAAIDKLAAYSYRVDAERRRALDYAKRAIRLGELAAQQMRLLELRAQMIERELREQNSEVHDHVMATVIFDWHMKSDPASNLPPAEELQTIAAQAAEVGGVV